MTAFGTTGTTLKRPTWVVTGPRMVKVGPALALYLGVLGERERVFDVDAEIGNRTLDLGVAEQTRVILRLNLRH
jgi:hypothetical protein